MPSSSLSSSSSAALSGFHSDHAKDCSALDRVRQSLAERRRSRVGVASDAAAAAAPVPVPPLSDKSRKVSSHRSSLSVDNGEAGDRRLRGQQPSAASDAVLSHVTEGALLSVSSASSSVTRATRSTSPARRKPSATTSWEVPPPRGVSYYGGFLPHTLDAHDLAAAVFPKAISTDSLPLPTSTSHPGGEASTSVAKRHGNAHSPQRSLTAGHRERSVAAARSDAAFDETLAEAMLSTAEHMLESQKWRDSAAHRQLLWHCSLPAIPAIGGVVAVGRGGVAVPALTAAPDSSPTRGLPEAPITSRAMAAFGHTAADVCAADADDKNGEGVLSVGLHRATAIESSQQRSHGARVHAGGSALTAATPREKARSVAAHGPDTRSRQSSTSSAPSILWDVAGRPVMDGCTREPSNVAHRRGGGALVAVSGSAAVPVAAGKETAPQLSYHQLTEAFYGCYKGGEMAQDAYSYFIAQQRQQQQHGPCGVGGSTGSLALCQRSSSAGARLRKGGHHQRSGSSASRRTASVTMPTHAAARARGGYTVQRIVEAGRLGSDPAATGAASAAPHAAPTRLRAQSISTEAPLPVWRRASDTTVAEEQRQRHGQPTRWRSVTSPDSARSNSNGSDRRGHAASTPTALAAAGSATADRIEALLSRSVSVYQEARQHRQQSRLRLDRLDA
ncbi:hypothetical protein LSCM1_08206 [Leishmania martiniquensis]|uniref:Uncharacterized protein n=1 Tax=Leishmania martiniquensis TaxID=1580590 RepID=A0A836L4F0_9TRYP|nr:hypothetical protein LSCM1_08206 [Leishmania martiniquensis]